MPRADPVLIFDLDGTILRRNSFPYWVQALLTGNCQGRAQARLALSWRVQKLLLRRKLGRLDHDAFLRALQHLWRQVGDPGQGMAAQLQSRLLNLVRSNLQPVLRSVGNLSVDSVLATAAAAEYAEPLGHALGFSYVLATPPTHDGAGPCNRGAHKCRRVLSFLEGHGWSGRPRIFFNDHMDDLPLMLESQTVCWFGSDKTLRAACLAAPETHFVPCTRLSAREMQQTLAHIQQGLETAQLACCTCFV